MLNIYPHLILLIALASSVSLPNGYEDAIWGISVKELQVLTNVHKASPGSGYTYSDHREVNPDVYVTKNSAGANNGNNKIEYYFFRNQLYKIYVIYDRSVTSEKFYRKLIQEYTKLHGEPHETYEEKIMGMTVKHAAWLTEESILDLRSASGYIYQVRTNRSAAAAKKLLQQFRRST